MAQFLVEANAHNSHSHSNGRRSESDGTPANIRYLCRSLSLQSSQQPPTRSSKSSRRDSTLQGQRTAGPTSWTDIAHVGSRERRAQFRGLELDAS
eukprot:1565304-Rhodomonas_salina.1